MAGVRMDTSALTRIQARIDQLAPDKLKKLQQRAVVSTARSLKAETSRAISEVQLNLNPSKISPFVKTTQGENFVAVHAAKKRIGLSNFGVSFSRNGASATTWRDSAPYVLPHAFKRGREAWQRIPGAGPSGMVGRLPIVMRKGPSIARSLDRLGPQKAWRDHGRQEVVVRLATFTQKKLSEEVARLLAAFSRV